MHTYNIMSKNKSNKTNNHSKSSKLMKSIKFEEINDIDENIYSEEEREFVDSNYIDNEQEVEQNSQITDELVENVINYTNYYDLIRDKKKELKELKDKSLPYREYILNFLSKQNVLSLDITDGKLIKNVSKKIQPLKEDIIKQSIINKTNNEELATQIIDEIKQIRTRSDKKNINLKRTYVKN